MTHEPIEKVIEQIDLALRSIGGIEFKEEFCKCDNSSGHEACEFSHIPCEYCALYLALTGSLRLADEVERLRDAVRHDCKINCAGYWPGKHAPNCLAESALGDPPPPYPKEESS